MRWPLAAAAAFLVPLAASPAAWAEKISLEAEAMFASHNVGGAAIVVTGCSAASKQLAVDGLDTEGEWIRIALDLPRDFCFIDSVRSAGSTGLVRTYAIVIEPTIPGPPSVADTLTTIPGSGIG
jgi:hypothetical protein